MKKITKRYFSDDKPTTKYAIIREVSRRSKLTEEGKSLDPTDPRIYDPKYIADYIKNGYEQTTIISVNVIDRLLSRTDTVGFNTPYIGEAWKRLLDADYFNLNNDNSITLCISWKNPMSEDSDYICLYKKNLVVFDGFLPIFILGISPYQGREGSILVPVPRSGRSIQIVTTNVNPAKVSGTYVGGEFYVMDDQVHQSFESWQNGLVDKYSDGSECIVDAGYDQLYPQWLENYRNNKAKGLVK